jgi:flagellar hook-basal body complex protein FliE
MSVEAVAALGSALSVSPPLAVDPELAVGPALTSAAPADSAFQSLLGALNQLNGELNAGEQALTAMASGTVDNLHQSMMGLEKVRLTLQLLLQVRSRALDAYQELMRMQI